MAKNVKIPLVMKNGEKATDMKTLVANFDIESVVGYFLDGKLEKWLTDRYYEDEAEVIAQLDKDDAALAKKLCDIFGIEYIESSEINTEKIAKRNERVARLKQLTDDEEVLRNIDSVAFNQAELSELYEKEIQKIYLCEGNFKLPKDKKHLEYTLVGGAKADKLPTEQELKSIFNSNKLSNITISEDIVGEKCFCNARIEFERPIVCSGSLKFENCEIVCGRIGNIKDPFSLGELNSMLKYNSIIKVINGVLEFKNCQIKGNAIPPKVENEWIKSKIFITRMIEYFIGGENSKIYFDNCELWSCRNLIGGKSVIGEITFTSCIGREINAPVIDGNLKRISITNCDFNGIKENNENMINLGEISRDCIEIRDSTFKGFKEPVCYTDVAEFTIEVGTRKRGPLDIIQDYINTPK